MASVPRRAFDRAADLMEQGIEQASWGFKDVPGVVPDIAKLLGMPDVEQTRRMACAILANAVVFHHRLAGITDEITPPRLVCGDAMNLQKPIREEWTRILELNYWSIFAIARDILNHIPAGAARWMLERLFEMTDEMETLGVTNAHDLTGRIFQRLIADRKYLATFYTLPASASLLARLAISLLDGVDWSDAGGDRPPPGGRLRLRHRRAAVRGVRGNRGAPRAGRRRRLETPSSADGGGPLRL